MTKPFFAEFLVRSFVPQDDKAILCGVFCEILLPIPKLRDGIRMTKPFFAEFLVRSFVPQDDKATLYGVSCEILLPIPSRSFGTGSG
jgi:hypothetical protein